MKNYSSNSVSPADVEEKVRAINARTQTLVDEVDAKQTEQIKKLRIWLAVSAAVNLLVAVGAYFF